MIRVIIYGFVGVGIIFFYDPEVATKFSDRQIFAAMMFFIMAEIANSADVVVKAIEKKK